MRSWVVRIVVALFAAFFVVPSPAAAASATPSGIVYTYDGAHPSAVDGVAQTERGPPSWSSTDTRYDAAARWLRRTLARPGDATTPRTYAYDNMAQLVPGDSSTSTAGTPGDASRRHDGVLSPLPRVQDAANGGRRAAQACRTNSFTASTLVLMADGSKKQIKEVKLGDKVMATDPETGETGPRKVVDLIRHGGLHTMVAVRLADGTTIDATDQHRRRCADFRRIGVLG